MELCENCSQDWITIDSVWNNSTSTSSYWLSQFYLYSPKSQWVSEGFSQRPHHKNKCKGHFQRQTLTENEEKLPQKLLLICKQQAMIFTTHWLIWKHPSHNSWQEFSCEHLSSTFLGLLEGCQEVDNANWRMAVCKVWMLKPKMSILVLRERVIKA